MQRHHSGKSRAVFLESGFPMLFGCLERKPSGMAEKHVAHMHHLLQRMLQPCNALFAVGTGKKPEAVM